MQGLKLSITRKLLIVVSLIIIASSALLLIMNEQLAERNLANLVADEHQANRDLIDKLFALYTKQNSVVIETLMYQRNERQWNEQFWFLELNNMLRNLWLLSPDGKLEYQFLGDAMPATISEKKAAWQTGSIHHYIVCEAECLWYLSLPMRMTNGQITQVIVEQSLSLMLADFTVFRQALATPVTIEDEQLRFLEANNNQLISLQHKLQLSVAQTQALYQNQHLLLRQNGQIYALQLLRDKPYLNQNNYLLISKNMTADFTAIENTQLLVAGLIMFITVSLFITSGLFLRKLKTRFLAIVQRFDLLANKQFAQVIQAPLSKTLFSDEITQVELEVREVAHTFEHHQQELERRHARIQRLSMLDELTDLPNRRSFNLYLETNLAVQATAQQNLALMLIDFDEFKTINDLHGHAAGDELLTTFANLLKRHFSKADFIGRLGSDEFVIALLDLSSDSDLINQAKRLLDAFPSPFSFGNYSSHISISIGLCFVPYQHPIAVSEVNRQMDMAMYTAKKEMDSSAKLYDVALDKEWLFNQDIINKLHLALAEERIYLAYQPLVNADNHRLVGFEALLRFDDAVLTKCGPEVVIKSVMHKQVLVDLECTVIQQVMLQIRAFLDEGLSFSYVSINLTPSGFVNQSLFEAIQGLLIAYKIPADTLCIELTEGSLMDDLGKGKAMVDRYHELGVLIALDDFGTGYSSLNYFKDLPVDIIKIDRSFVQNMSIDSKDVEVVNIIINLAQRFNLTVVAEGIETLAMVEKLMLLNCLVMQGYYYSRPIAAHQLAAELAEKVDAGHWVMATE